MVANSHDNITGGLLFVISERLRCASPFVANAQAGGGREQEMSLRVLSLSLPNQGLCR